MSNSEEKQWGGLDCIHERKCTIRASSNGRYWTGVDAAILETTGGNVVFPELSRYNVGMHLSEPVVATYHCAGTTIPRAPGDVNIIPFGYPAAWEDAGPTTSLSISLEPSLVRSAANSMGVDYDRVTLIPQLHQRDPIIQHIALALKAELENPGPYGRLFADGLGLSLAVHLLRNCPGASLSEFTRGLSQRQLLSIVDYIHDNLARDLSLAELAAVSGVSASHFKVLFKLSMGQPVHKYVVRCRVEHAVKLLTRGQSTLSEIALQAGFADQSHMARCMRRVLGVTPSDVLQSRGFQPTGAA
jgi:AraC family transcriptional regulator